MGLPAVFLPLYSGVISPYLQLVGGPDLRSFLTPPALRKGSWAFFPTIFFGTYEVCRKIHHNNRWTRKIQYLWDVLKLQQHILGELKKLSGGATQLNWKKLVVAEQPSWKPSVSAIEITFDWNESRPFHIIFHQKKTSKKKISSHVSFLKYHKLSTHAHTVDGRNPKQPPGMYKTRWIMGYLPYQLLQDFWTINISTVSLSVGNPPSLLPHGAPPTSLRGSIRGEPWWLVVGGFDSTHLKQSARQSGWESSPSFGVKIRKNMLSCHHLAASFPFKRWVQLEYNWSESPKVNVIFMTSQSSPSPAP